MIQAQPVWQERFCLHMHQNSAILSISLENGDERMGTGEWEQENGNRRMGMTDWEYAYKLVYTFTLQEMRKKPPN